MGKRRLKREISLDMVLDEKDIGKLFRYFGRSSHRQAGRQKALILDILINTGLRANELCGLKVRNTPYYIGANVITVKESKGRNRSVPVSKGLAERIGRYIDGDRRSRLPRHTRTEDPNGWLFYNMYKRRMKYHCLYSMIVRAGPKAGIRRHIRPHFTRHTFATVCLNKGIPIRDLQKMLGHSQLSTTARYLHVIGKRQFQHAEALEAGFSSIVPNYYRQSLTQ